jgi:peptidoglycan/xylan/chitin deacetylase (PgdA/CDA1 family)
MPRRSADAVFARGRAPLVLCYHALTDAWPDALAVSPPVFERQLWRLVRRGFRSVPAGDVLSRRGRLFHVTFDDAYTNVYAMLPRLKRLGLHATVFACSDFARDGTPLLIPELRARAAGFEPELATMDWDALRDSAEQGFEIGSHTVSHPHLPALSDEELRRELRDSRDAVADEVGLPCRFLAYPFGEYDRRVRDAAEAAGYTAAFALRRRGGSPPDPFALPRIDIYRRDTRLRFRVKTSPARRPVVRLVRSARAGTR